MRDVMLRDLDREIGDVHLLVLPTLDVETRRDLTVRGFVKLEAESPVLTGKYQASHWVSAGFPKIVRLPDAPSYATKGAAHPRSALKSLKAGQTIHIRNDVQKDGASEPYGQFLEPPYVASPQSPNGPYTELEAWMSGQAMRESFRKAKIKAERILR